MAQEPSDNGIAGIATHAENALRASKRAGRSLRTMAQELARMRALCEKYGINLVIEDDDEKEQ